MKWRLVGIVLGIVLLYPLSYGPVWVLIGRKHLGQRVLGYYQPFLGDKLMERYASIWLDIFPPESDLPWVKFKQREKS